MPDLPFKCIWWGLILLLLTGHFSIDAGTYLLYSWTLFIDFSTLQICEHVLFLFHQMLELTRIT